MKKLKAPIGADGANVGTNFLKADDAGNVMVPDMAVPSLVGVGGFALLSIPEDHVIMHSLIGYQSCTIAGISYETDGSDCIIVPNAVSDDLLSHNFEYFAIADAPVAGA